MCTDLLLKINVIIIVLVNIKEVKNIVQGISQLSEQHMMI